MRIAILFLAATLSAQDTKNWTTADDHRNMMEQLGIKALRPGPSGNESAPNHANYDEATANPFPVLPDPLKLKNGKKVTSAKMWWDQRRPEIVEDFEREVLGRVPANVPKVTWSVTNTVEATIAGHPVVGKQLVGHVDNSAYPDITVDIQMTLVTPKDARAGPGDDDVRRARIAGPCAPRGRGRAWIRSASGCGRTPCWSRWTWAGASGRPGWCWSGSGRRPRRARDAWRHGNDDGGRPARDGPVDR